MKKLCVAFILLFSSVSFAADNISGPAPDFTLKSRDGKNVRLADLRGQVVMLNFWASWCGPCRQEMPILDDLAKRYGRAGFTLLGVNVEQDSSAGEKYLKDTPVNFPILWDPTSQVSKLYNIDAMPSTVMIDRDGNMRYLHRGYKPGYENDYKKQIKELIRE